MLVYFIMNQRWKSWGCLHGRPHGLLRCVGILCVGEPKKRGAAKEVNDELKTHKLGYGGFLSHGSTPKSSIKQNVYFPLFSMINQPFWGTSIYGNLHISPITLVIDPQTSLNLKLHEGERLLVLFSRIHHGIVNISNEYGRICRFLKSWGYHQLIQNSHPFSRIYGDLGLHHFKNPP